MSAHSQTLATVIGSAVGIVTLGGVAVRSIKKPLKRTADVMTAFFGEPADPVSGKPERKPLMVQLAELAATVLAVAKRVDDANNGNVEIMRRQGLQDDRLRAVESKVGQTLTAVRNSAA